MDTYLMMLYVSLEQETALKQFFLQNGWQYCRPDLAVVTDNIGPHVEQVPHFVEKFTEADYMPSKPQRVRKAIKRKAQEASVEVEPETEHASDGSDTHSDIDNGEAVHSDIEDTECIPEIKVELVSDVADDNEYVDHVNSDPDYEPGDDGLHDIVKEKRKTKGLNTESSVNVQNTDGTVLDDSGSETDIPKPTPAKRKKKGRKSTVSTVADEANTSKTKKSQLKYRCYSQTSMTNAYIKVKETGASIRGTAREYNVPEASLRHKVSGRVNPEATRSGPKATLGQEEEAMLVEHLKFTASVGYGFSRREVVNMATEFAISLKLREESQTLSMGWYEHFKVRWPDVKCLNPRGLESPRALATSKEKVDKYYSELQQVLTKYHLEDKPERIYNVDEKGLWTEHNPPPVDTTTGSKTYITVIGCGNAQGQQIPPFFVFPGSRMNQALLEGGSPGVNGGVSESGCSNGDIFKKYLESHLLKHLPERSFSSPVLLLYDGHRAHVHLGLIKWARSKNIILFVLPAHTSHVLKTFDTTGCFGPFERIYNSICKKFMSDNCGRYITKFDVCKLGSEAYLKALSPGNLQSLYRKAGIYPFNSNALNLNALNLANCLAAATCEQDKPADITTP